ncbi:MAG: HAD hydrolase-like protein [Nitrososphaerales archaeon]|nr:HAD hydrolase-like protein [Nitrososphaerales archaeon]
MEIKDFTYLTFDCYGTLIDWKAGIVRSLEESFRLPHTDEGDLMERYVEAEKAQEGAYKRYREVLKGTALKLARDLGAPASEEASAKFAASVPEWPAFKDTTDSLRALGEMGYKRYILSNVDEDLLRETIRRHGLEVEGFVTAEEVKSYKPSYGHWMRFFEKTGANKKELLHVAQSLFHDIAPTGQLGIASAWVNRYGEQLPSNVEPLFVCESLSQLVGLLD